MIGNQTVEKHEREYALEGGGDAKLAVWRKSGGHWQAAAQARLGSFFHSTLPRDLGPAGTEAKAWELAVTLAEACLSWCQSDAKSESERQAVAS